MSYTTNTVTVYQEAVLHIVRAVPKGQVASYGQVAAYIGTPRAARQVGWTMRSLAGTQDFPWWRILNNAGHITIKGDHVNTARLQKELLEAEGVVITHNQGYELDIEKYRFRPSRELILSWHLDATYVDTTLRKFGLA